LKNLLFDRIIPAKRNKKKADSPIKNYEHRQLGPKDLDLALAMNHGFRRGLVHEEAAGLFLANPKNWLFTCLDSKKVLAFAYGYELDRLDPRGPMLYIHELGVLPSYQHQGLGQEFMEALLERARGAGISKVFLITHKHNQPACHLYEKIGGQAMVGSQDDDRVYVFFLE
jgi:ribosomal protein S18 acetylase RimI-like enzyme